MDYSIDVYGPPLSVQEIAARAVNFDYNPEIALKFWLRTAESLLKEATIYEREGNEQQAYLLFLRHAELLLKYLPKHPEADLPENRKHHRMMRQRLNEDMQHLEYLKPRIHTRYLAYQQAQNEREARTRKGESNRSSSSAPTPASSSPSSSRRSLEREYIPYRPGHSRQGSQGKGMDDSYRRPSSSSSSLASLHISNPYYQAVEKERVDASLGNTDLALELARQEFARREKEKIARKSSGRGESASKWRDKEVTRVTTPDARQARDRYDSLRKQYASPSRSSRRESDGSSFDLQKQIQSLSLQSGALHDGYTSSRRESRGRGPEKSRDSSTKGSSWTVDYPSIPKRSSVSTVEPLPQFPPSLTEYSRRAPYVSTAETRTPPPLPPLPDSFLPPAVPKKTPLRSPSPQPLPPSLPTLPYTLAKPSPPPPPKLPAELSEPHINKPTRRTSTYEFKPSARLESGQRLRTIFLPANLRFKFLEIAQPNTVRNLETCGVLCGTLIQNALFISRLVIPEQIVTSDTCDMTDEEELFKYVDGEDLMVLGWIHTHPTYECFMSSVDLHNHCSYQLMLPESIAVVCAPKYEPSWGVFRLTDPPGVKTIMSCKERALFHQHPGADGLYTDAMRPGHVVVVEAMEFEVIDLRK